MDLVFFILYPYVINGLKLYALYRTGINTEGRLTHGSNIQWLMFMHPLSHIAYWFLMMHTLGGI